MRKILETVVAVTHTQTVLDNKIARNSKAFNVPINIRRNLKFSCILITVILGFFLLSDKKGELNWKQEN